MIKYEYKKGRKYPHVIYYWRDGMELSDFYTSINPWVKENIGVYCKDWFCPGTLSDHEIGAPYAFKTIENAMAFKLRWI